MPTNRQHMTDLESAGVVFGQARGERAVMFDVALPGGWGHVITSDRGDIIHSFLVDDRGYRRSSISWMSKGSYDNMASMSMCEQTHRINPVAVVVDARGNITADMYTKTPAQAYVTAANNFHRMHRAGESQQALDAAWDELQVLESAVASGDRIRGLEKLTTTKGTAQYQQDAIMGMAVAWRDPFHVPKAGLWIEVGDECEQAPKCEWKSLATS